MKKCKFLPVLSILGALVQFSSLTANAIEDINIKTGVRVPENPKHEFLGGTNSALRFFGGNTNIGINLGYEYFLFPDWSLQVGYNTNFTYTTNGTNSATDWLNIFNVRYNLQQIYDTSLLNAFYVDGGLGFDLVNPDPSTGSGTTAKFAYEFGAGKRFQIGQNISYTPRVSIQKVQDRTATLVITPIQVSVFFN
jgi:hypothetical protein